MKIQSTNTQQQAQKEQGGKQAVRTLAPSSVSFGMGPITSGTIATFDWIEKGGFAASFIVNDMLGTNFPRAYQAMNRGKEQTGKRNWKAAAEVTLREFITGPSMFLVPGIVLWGARKMTGSANDVPISSLRDFSEVMKNTKLTEKAPEVIKKDFYTQLFKDIAKHTFDEGKGIDAELYAKKLLKVDDMAPKANFLQRWFDKGTKAQVKEYNQAFGEIVEMFVRDKKASVDYGKDFTTAILHSKEEVPINKLIKNVQNYANEAATYINKEFKKAPQGFVKNTVVENFKNKRVFTRFVTNPAALLATAAFLSIIPKIYSFNKVNPETEALYEQVNSNRKGAVNAKV